MVFLLDEITVVIPLVLTVRVLHLLFISLLHLQNLIYRIGKK